MRLDSLEYTKQDIESNIHNSKNTVSKGLTLAGGLNIY